MAMGLFLACLLPQKNSGDWTHVENVVFAALLRLMWSVGLVILALAQLAGLQLEPIDALLTFRIWRPLGKLTFAAYLCHPIIMSVFFLSRSTYLHYDDGWIAMMFLAFLCCSYAIAVVMTLVVEAPFMQLMKLVLGGGGGG